MRLQAVLLLGLAIRTTSPILRPRILGHASSSWTRCHHDGLPMLAYRTTRLDKHDRSPFLKVSKQQGSQLRAFTADVSTILAPPLVFLGLLVGLWTYKCIMMVVFQNKIIYMPSVPPFARSERIEDYKASCRPVEWRQQYVRSLDGTRLGICVGKIPESNASRTTNRKHIVICYFQGNGGSLPPRLPQLSSILSSLHSQDRDFDRPRYTLVALSYRGYWTSSGRPSQPGIELDAQALLEWVDSTFLHKDGSVSVVLWGQSLGAGVAATAMATSAENRSKALARGLILETPFTSISNMLVALYPQPWLPYRYLSPFLWNHWDTEKAIRRLANAGSSPSVLLLSAAGDEIVPPDQVEKLKQVCLDAGHSTSSKHIANALHTDATIKREGRQVVVDFVTAIAKM